MSKQDKIEKSQEAKASRVTEVKTVMPASATFTSASVGQRYWQINGTQYYSQKKEDLKSVRRVLNLQGGINEVEADIVEGKIVVDKVAAVPPKDWKFHVSKGPDHPSLVATKTNLANSLSKKFAQAGISVDVVFE